MMGMAKPHIIGEELVEEVMTGEEHDATPAERPEELRLLEALLFAAGEPLDDKTLRSRMPEGVDIASAMRRLQAEYAPRGINLVWRGCSLVTPLSPRSCRAPPTRRSRSSPIISR
jgi:hypothetical protein